MTQQFHCWDYTLRILKHQFKRTTLFVAAQFTVAKCWKQPQCPSVNECIKKLWYIYTMEYYTAEWMGLENIMLSEISQAVKDKYHMISPIRGH